MPKYTEEVIVIDINDRPSFGRNCEEAMEQGFVFHGNPLVNGEQYVQVMVKQTLLTHIAEGHDVRAYMRELKKARKLLAEKKKESVENEQQTEEGNVEVPFG